MAGIFDMVHFELKLGKLRAGGPMRFRVWGNEFGV